RRGARRGDKPNQRSLIRRLEGPKDHSVDDGEDRGVGADAERQRENRDERKPRLPPKGSKSIRNVLPKFTHGRNPAPFRTRVVWLARRSAKLICWGSQSRMAFFGPRRL